jgi:hypothetical protein
VIAIGPKVADAQRAMRGLRDRRRDQGNRRARSYAFTSLTPIRPGEAAAVARELRRFDADEPFRRVPEIHCARLLVVDQLKTDWEGVPRPVPRLKSEYLLFTADVTAPAYDGYVMPGAFLAGMYVRMRSEIDAVWGRCLGFRPGGSPEAFSRYLQRSQLDTSLYYVGYPGVTPREVGDAVRVRRELIEFVRGVPADPVWSHVRDDYLQRAERRRWFPSN